MTITRIVNYRQQWAICDIAIVDEPPGQYDLPGDAIEQYEAWVYGRDRAVLCRVGQSDATYPLPDWQPTNFFRDRFPFAIDRKARYSDYVEKVGGSVNALAAIAAFEAFVRLEGPETEVTLRHGARVMRCENGQRE